MVKRIVVTGCRDYDNYKEAKIYIDFCIRRIKDEYELVFVSGDCRGADKLGERYALENVYEVEYYPAEWEKYGKSRGTGSMIKYAERYGKELKVKYI